MVQYGSVARAWSGPAADSGRELAALGISRVARFRVYPARVITKGERSKVERAWGVKRNSQSTDPGRGEAAPAPIGLELPNKAGGGNTNADCSTHFDEAVSADASILRIAGHTL